MTDKHYELTDKRMKDYRPGLCLCKPTLYTFADSIDSLREFTSYEEKNKSEIIKK